MHFAFMSLCFEAHGCLSALQGPQLHATHAISGQEGLLCR